MRFAAFTLSTLVASAAAGVIVTKDNIDYSGVDWKNVDYSNVDWTKIDYSGGGNNNNDNKKTNDQTTQTNQNTVDNTVVVPQKQQKEPEKAPEPSAAPVPSEIPAVPISVPTTLSTKVATSTSSAAAPAKTSEVAQTTTTTSNGDLSGDKEKALAAHNAARSAVGNSPLSWDDSLASDAQAYANVIAGLKSLVHSSGSGQGENLYYQSNSDAPLLNAANSFLGEKSLYHDEVISGSNFASFGHYTQAVWKTTTKVGMASAKAADGTVYVVCRYSPPGNFIGEKPY